MIQKIREKITQFMDLTLFTLDKTLLINKFEFFISLIKLISSYLNFSQVSQRQQPE